ncbi:MAG: peptidoglycan glycosyltransferase, partial [Selenomonas sp.]|nr:peptidoglycan glycosyltransferase [Selenomonas sp.]
MLAAMVIVVLRYAWLQLVEGDKLAARMRAQVGQEFRTQSPRGPILDRNGRELAVSIMTKSLFIDPSQAQKKDTAALAAGLAPLIGKTPEDVEAAVEKGGGFVWLKHFLTQDEYEAVRAWMRKEEYTDCLGFIDEAKRYYPSDALAANVVGFVGAEDKGL